MKFRIGQKWTSTAEPDLGVGQIIAADFRTITLLFPITGEQRIYNAKGVPPLKRYSLKKGEKAISIKGQSLFVETISEENGIFFYKNKDKSISEAILVFKRASEDNLVEIIERLPEKPSRDFEFNLRIQAAKLRGKWKSSIARGMLGPKLKMLPHQLYLAYRATRAPSLPRLMLSDEVGLGKTIESGLIWRALQTEGRIKRTLIIVPEQLKNQWIIEMGKRFSHWFTNVSEDYYVPDVFSIHDTVLCSIEFLLSNKFAANAALDVSWDLVIIDEAHRLIKTSKGANAQYNLAEAFAQKNTGLLLLSGTPIQLAPEAYFYRLKLLDSARFQNWEEFEKNQENYRKIASDLENISFDSTEELSWEDLQKSIPKDSLIHSWLPIKSDLSLTAEEWVRRVIDALGTGSSVFRNTRKSVKGFPKRTLKTYPISTEGEVRTEGEELNVWLQNFIKENKNEKILLLCSTSETVLGLLSLFEDGEAVAFKEEESSLERDKAVAAWMQKDGPNLLLSSEIGSEGRNFQNAKHLILFDLPEDSSLLEQRIGRLDRIGQGEEIFIHVPFIKNSKGEMLYLWYHEALGIFEHSLMGGGEIYAKFEDELKSYLESSEKKFNKFVKEFLPRGKKEMLLLNEKAEAGRDKLLEFNSQNKKLSEELIAETKKMDSNEELLQFAFNMLECLDIDVQKGAYPNSFVFKGSSLEHATLLGLDVSHSTENGEISEFGDCSITVATDRESILAYENIEYFHWEHPIMQRLFDKALNDYFGAAACISGSEDRVEYNFILDFPINSNWGVNHLLPERLLSTSVLGQDVRGGFELAKEALKGKVEKITKETKNIVISTLEGELHRIQETYALIRNFELGKTMDKKKRELVMAKKSLDSPKLRLDSVRLVCKS